MALNDSLKMGITNNCSTYKKVSFIEFKSDIYNLVDKCTMEIIQRDDDLQTLKPNDLVNEIKGSIISKIQNITGDLKFIGTLLICSPSCI